MAEELLRSGRQQATISFEIARFTKLDELRQLWEELEQRADPPVFLSWPWVSSWLNEAALDPDVVIGRVGSIVVLLGTLVPATRRDVLPIAVRGLHLNMIGDPLKDVITTEYNGFLTAREYVGCIERDTIHFLLSGVCVDGRKRDELHMKNVATGFERFVSASGYLVREVQRKPSWRVDLAAIRASRTHYLDHLSANTRQQIRRSMRLYQKRGPLVATVASDTTQALQFLDEMKELHQCYWNSRGQPGGFSFPFFEAFQRRLIHACMPHGIIDLVSISAGPFVIGFLYNLVYRGHVNAYQSGFNYEEDARLKPGLVSHTLSIAQHLERDSLVYDFLAGDHRYKANLGEPGPDMLYLLAERPTWPLQLESALHGVKRWVGGFGLRLRNAN